MRKKAEREIILSPVLLPFHLYLDHPSGLVDPRNKTVKHLILYIRLQVSNHRGAQGYQR